MWLGAVGFVALFGAVGGWAATTVIGGAVVASGQAVVPGKPQIVQSLDGGIVRAIHVKDGDVVAADTLLMQLDPTLLEVNLDIARGRLAAALARQARLKAEQLGLASPDFTLPDLPFAAPDISDPVMRETAIFLTRADTLQGQRDQLAETLSQLDSQRQGTQGQVAAVQEQAALLDRDLDALRTLSEQGLVRQSQLSQLQRARAQLTGEMAGLRATLARLDIAGRDARLELRQAEHAFREEVMDDLRETTAQVEELTLEIVTRTAQLARIDIRAPTGGIVHEMQVATKGGVVPPGGTILEVIPLDRGLDFELRVDPRSIDQVHPGQSAELVLASFDPQATPQLKGQVTTISAGKITDPQTGQEFYRVGLDVSPDELARAGDVALVPGMPVEAYLHTGDRTVLAYLLHPVSSHLRRAFRE
jgi:HlyD family secretion protein